MVKPPVSSSFPSGHAASAAAFATAVALDAPVAAAVIAPLAVAVGYSRVHIGVHWPSDVVAGLLDVRYLRADLPFSRARLIWATVTGTLDSSPTYVRRQNHQLEVRVDGAPVSLATDGEVDDRGTHFTFRSRSDALTLFRAPDSGTA